MTHYTTTTDYHREAWETIVQRTPKRMVRPTHPGEMLREDFLPDSGLSVAGLAAALGVSRQTINELLKERRALSAEMALRLARLFGNTPDFWLNAQQAVDLWEAEQLVGAQVERIRPLGVGNRPDEATLVQRLGLDQKTLGEFSNRHGILELAAFGSVLRDDYGPDSDIDILVNFVPGAKVSLFDLVDMADELSGMLGRRVDLVPKQGLKRFVRESILEDARVIYAAA